MRRLFLSRRFSNVQTHNLFGCLHVQDPDCCSPGPVWFNAIHQNSDICFNFVKDGEERAQTSVILSDDIVNGI